MTAARLVVVCPDRPGIVAAVSRFLFDRGANIVDSAQHSTDPAEGTFFMRMEFTDERVEGESDFATAFAAEVANRFAMTWRLASATHRPRIAILVSQHDHCLLDILWRWRRGELPADVACVVSNHQTLEQTVAPFDVPYFHVPVDAGGMPAAEAAMLDRLGENIELVVLARYMRILSRSFLDRVAAPAINIHHSFLPAFVGANPYRRALERGVKIIGATAHYVTEALDDGPIIEQDVQRVSHRHGLADLEQIGRDIERTVLARALRWHLEDRVVVHGNKTFVFE